MSNPGPSYVPCTCQTHARGPPLRADGSRHTRRTIGIDIFLAAPWAQMRRISGATTCWPISVKGSGVTIQTAAWSLLTFSIAAITTAIVAALTQPNRRPLPANRHWIPRLRRPALPRLQHPAPGSRRHQSRSNRVRGLPGTCNPTC